MHECVKTQDSYLLVDRRPLIGVRDIMIHLFDVRQRCVGLKAFIPYRVNLFLTSQRLHM